MAQLTHGDVTIRYEDYGDGPPVLLVAPGALESTVEAWQRAAINPIELFADEFRLIAMDQRNAGASRGPLPIDDPWGAYVEDQLGVLDYLGIDTFQMIGCCIGCSYGLKLAEVAPARLSGAVLEQPIGSVPENKQYWIDGRRAWAERLLERRTDLSLDDAETFGATMWDDKEFVLSVSRSFVQSCPTPLLVLPGVDLAHPHVTGVEVAELAPNAQVIDPWRDTPELLASAAIKVREFLRVNAG